jgi:TldD protein
MSESSQPATRREVDESFLDTGCERAAQAALEVASAAGASWCDARGEGTKWRGLTLRDVVVEFQGQGESLGIGVRVVLGGAWGFASEPGCDETSARTATLRALEMAKMAKPLTTSPVLMGQSPALGQRQWCSEYLIDPFDVSDAELVQLFRDRAAPLVQPERFADSYCSFVKEQKHYADLSGNALTTQRLRSIGSYTLTQVSGSEFVSLRTLAAPSQRGFEWMVDAYPWDAELAELPDLLTQKSMAPRIDAGTYDLLLDATNLWLTIHESIGHATELDRILGYEANYAGTSFITPGDVGSLVYGSPLLNVTADRNQRYGLSTVPFDDEGTATSSFPLITDGVLVDLQRDRSMGDSNGCAYADSYEAPPLSRMPNVSVTPQADGPSVKEMLSEMGDGLYVRGDDSWSIDTQRNNFQFTGQQFWRVRGGRVEGMVRDAAYQSNTRQFWQSLRRVGGPETYVLGGAENCGKGQPGQVAPVSHGAPACLFDQVRVLNVKAEN